MILRRIQKKNRLPQFSTTALKTPSIYRLQIEKSLLRLEPSIMNPTLWQRGVLLAFADLTYCPKTIVLILTTFFASERDVWRNCKRYTERKRIQNTVVLTTHLRLHTLRRRSSLSRIIMTGKR